MPDDLTKAEFFQRFPQFVGISEVAKSTLTLHLEEANRKVSCAKWGEDCSRGRALLAAHRLAITLEMIGLAKENPEGGGGLVTFSNRIREEKVGEVEVKFHAAAAAGSSSNEHNDPLTKEYNSTIYGKQFIALMKIHFSGPYTTHPGAACV